VAQGLAGEVAIVTGAGAGFGRRIALRLAAEGAAVTVFARRKHTLDEVVSEIEREGGRALAIAGDATEPEDVSRAARATEQRLGPVSLLVNNAGRPTPYGPIGVADPQMWWESQAVHIRGPLLFLSALLPGMRARRKGHIVTIASLAGLAPVPHLSAYALGKCAQIRLMEQVALEGKGFGIAAFSMEPGTVTTDMAESTMADPEAQKWIPEGVAMLKGKKEAEDANPGLREAGFKRCCDMVADLLSGRYDILSGRYFDPSDDFEALAEKARAT
jgi:NAD(P)-dependent dehydrogenase (short-subunit alcohol dehydrogenase family)